MNDLITRARGIFERAIEFESAEDQNRFVRESCANDSDLLALVKRLLLAHVQAGGFLPAEPAATAEAGASPDLPDLVIGRYKPLHKIGEGGMGVVYLAEQQAPVRRRVALKIIKLGMDTKEVVARFEAERQALALMDHPHIAKVLDGGATEMGRTFFVMEFVPGAPITECCQTKRLSLQNRIQLFIEVCQAVQHAHQKGVIHRDLKPSNVLVTLQHGVPVPKIIDFGVAKATAQRLTEKTLFTQHTALIGTPAYMSPEQAGMNHADVDTRSDIYSLGVLLYELLTGTLPFPEKRLRSASPSEMHQILTQEVPERPSSRLRQRARSSSADDHVAQTTLPTDLDWIVMKCLEKDPSRRYASANGLASDLQRHLESRPVTARPPSLLYDLQKSIRRHRLPFAAAAGIIVALGLGLAASLWQAARSEAQLEATLKFINVVFSEVSPTVNQMIGGAKANRVLAASGQRLMDTLRQHSNSIEDSGSVLGWLLVQLAFTQAWPIGNTSGDYAAGLTNATEAVRLLTLHGSERLNDEQIYHVFEAEMVAGFAAYGLLRYEAAVEHYHQMEAWADRLSCSTNPRWAAMGRIRKLWAQGCVTDVLLDQNPALVESLLAEHRLRTLEELQARYTNVPHDDCDQIGNIQGEADMIGTAWLRSRKYAEAVSWYRLAFRTVQDLPKQKPNGAAEACRVVESAAKLGASLLASGHSEEGTQRLDEALLEAEALLGRDSANVGFLQLKIRVLTLAAMGEAALASDPTIEVAVRRQELTQASQHFHEAERLIRELKPACAGNLLRADLQRTEGLVRSVEVELAKQESPTAAP